MKRKMKEERNTNNKEKTKHEHFFKNLIAVLKYYFKLVSMTVSRGGPKGPWPFLKSYKIRNQGSKKLRISIRPLFESFLATALKVSFKIKLLSTSLSGHNATLSTKAYFVLAEFTKQCYLSSIKFSARRVYNIFQEDGRIMK